ncbi:uracil-DNA glycosylase family protein [Pseudooceanicola sp. CBS1P-1]|uniref:Uracil-DNA glycosylase family protein n=1 Tax=Pseudooceanicola albus TaxID=2692189 RepID=A0A6L7G604_9RHOB|nr:MULTISPECIES: uracil-DNA glycosylase family protein [Pseudooceanicola]MBT9384902.1 uracil-DNA glycosylase family protein [Pseudooceanicola endophyticus]MXN18103.1 uracil-DNA glycosylase family protein [Pseudooceanicola albus]
MKTLLKDLRACRLCAPRFAATRTHHAPAPVVWLAPQARILIAGQAPGLQAHEKQRPFDDRSGDRLRAWMGLTRGEFYDLSRIAFLPAALCFPGYDARGADLPPPPICAATWQARILDQLPRLRLRLLIGGYSQKLHLGTRAPLTQVVAGWRDHLPGTIPLPHPSWRNTAWLRRNPWFETDLLPVLRAEVRKAME